MIPVHRIHELVRLDRITVAEGADILTTQTHLRHVEGWMRFFAASLIVVCLGTALALLGCGDNVAPPEPDADVTAEPANEPPPTACLPWPCPDGGPP